MKSVGLFQDDTDEFTSTASRILRAAGYDVRVVFPQRPLVWAPDVIVMGSAGEITILEVKNLGSRVQDVVHTFVNTPVVLAGKYFTPEVTAEAVRAGVVSVVPLEALPQVIENLRCLRGATSTVLDTSVLVPKIHDPDSGRLDAKRLAELYGISLHVLAKAVGVTPSTLSKRPTAPSAQNGLRELAFVWGALLNLYRSEGKARAWLHAPRPDLGFKPPMSLLVKGSARHLGNYIHRALAGEPA